MLNLLFESLKFECRNWTFLLFFFHLFVSVSLQGYYPSNKPGVEPRRPCRPINITSWLHLSNASNRVTITWGNFGKVSPTAILCQYEKHSSRDSFCLEKITLEIA